MSLQPSVLREDFTEVLYQICHRVWIALHSIHLEVHVSEEISYDYDVFLWKCRTM